MKKLFIVLMVACAVVTLTAFASDVKVNPKVASAFSTSFSNASNVKWTQVQHLYQATFEMNKEQYSAYFNADGNLEVLARFITDAQLPHGLKESLKQHTKESRVLYLFELNDNEGVHYYVTLQKGDKKEMLRSAGSKKWMPYNKVKI